MKNFSSKEIRFSGDSNKSCVCFIDLVDSTKNTMTMDNLEHIRIYYSKFINSISKIVKSYGGKVIKNIGDCLLLYFPKTADNKNEDAFGETNECNLKILDVRYAVTELHLLIITIHTYKRKTINLIYFMYIIGYNSLSLCTIL